MASVNKVFRAADTDTRQDAAGSQSALGQTSAASDDVNSTASPASAPESILGGIYDGEYDRFSLLKSSYNMYA